jgi:hypothetical protein|tara:strand:- start:1282 stop:1974 length:693 start_codon:yes stop_codon:yes gene_type:complete
MAIATTNSFNLNIGEIVEEAYERAGLQARTGYDYRTARRSIDMMMLEWQNRGINLWTIESGTQTLTADTATYTLPDDTIDLMETHLRLDAGDSSSQSDYQLTRISPTQYSDIPNKLQVGQPTQIWIQRLTTTPQFTLWPVPDSTRTYTVAYYRIRQIYDSGTEGSNNMDVPKRFIPCLVSGLAYYVAMKRPEVTDRLPFLKQEYEEQWKLASEEDRIKASFRFVPWTSYN